jgi:pre-mRNA-processing factor 19
VGLVSLNEDNAIAYNLNIGKGHATSAVWAQDRAVIATSTGSVKVFEKDQEISSFSAHAGKANAIALHPSGSIAASVGDDKSYALYDLSSGQVLSHVHTNSSEPIAFAVSLRRLMFFQVFHVHNFIPMAIC